MLPLLIFISLLALTIIPTLSKQKGVPIPISEEDKAIIEGVYNLYTKKKKIYYIEGQFKRRSLSKGGYSEEIVNNMNDIMGIDITLPTGVTLEYGRYYKLKVLYVGLTGYVIYYEKVCKNFDRQVSNSDKINCNFLNRDMLNLLKDLSFKFIRNLSKNERIFTERYYIKFLIIFISSIYLLIDSFDKGVYRCIFYLIILIFSFRISQKSVYSIKGKIDKIVGKTIYLKSKIKVKVNKEIERKNNIFINSKFLRRGRKKFTLVDLENNRYISKHNLIKISVSVLLSFYFLTISSIYFMKIDFKGYMKALNKKNIPKSTMTHLNYNKHIRIGDVVKIDGDNLIFYSNKILLIGSYGENSLDEYKNFAKKIFFYTNILNLVEEDGKEIFDLYADKNRKDDVGYFIRNMINSNKLYEIEILGNIIEPLENKKIEKIEFEKVYNNICNALEKEINSLIIEMNDERGKIGNGLMEIKPENLFAMIESKQKENLNISNNWSSKSLLDLFWSMINDSVIIGEVVAIIGEGEIPILYLKPFDTHKFDEYYILILKFLNFVIALIYFNWKIVEEVIRIRKIRKEL